MRGRGFNKPRGIIAEISNIMPEKGIHENEGLLIQNSLEGDLEAFEKLIEPYGKRIYSLSFQLLGNRSDAEDILQDSFIQAYKSLKYFKGDSKFYTWLYKIVVNLCYNHKKRNWRMLVLPPTVIESLHNKSKDHNDDHHQTREIHQAVRTAIRSLSDPLRRVMILITYHGLSHREAAEVEGCSEGTISWRSFQARECLRKELVKYREYI